MGQIRRYIDASVIIDAVSPSRREQKIRALAVLEDRGRAFILSDFVKLETLPKMKYNQRHEQVNFTEAFFRDADEYVHSSEAIITEAERLAITYGLAAMDALHVASAIAAGADELITCESPTKPFFRIPPYVLKVVSLHSAAA